ncbi:alpha/beta fold hydrolase [Pararhodobacter marinus]|uniref:alpha/beta fold hydrolase n=1 Tax=Pararhodobacter marinus TaxID=2184063 RepID=UPI0035193750
MPLRTPDGATVQWRDHGTGAPLVALHPHTATGAFFEPLAQVLPGVHLIAPDRRGYGGSTRGEGYAEVTQAEDLLHLLDHLDLPRVNLLGVAAGGGPAAAFSLRWPDRVQHLVLACSFLGQSARFWQGLTGETPPEGDATERELSQAVRHTPRADAWRAQVARNQAQNAGEPPQPCSVDLSALASIPNLHLWTGIEDRLFTPAMLTEAARLLPNARTRVLPDVAHAAPWEDPQGFAEALTAVLNPA